MSLQVLEQRHSQELQDLNVQCEAEKMAVLTEAMSKLQSEHDAEREKILSQHEREMNNLLSLGANLTPAQLEERKLQLLNSQQQRLKLVEMKLFYRIHTVYYQVYFVYDVHIYMYNLFYKVMH